MRIIVAAANPDLMRKEGSGYRLGAKGRACDQEAEAPACGSKCGHQLLIGQAADYFVIVLVEKPLHFGIAIPIPEGKGSGRIF